MNSRMPDLRKAVIRFLKLICRCQLFEEIEGDIIQRYFRDAKRFVHLQLSDAHREMKFMPSMQFSLVKNKCLFLSYMLFHH